jgi:tetratricopeptide (TPR) repeat protein
MQGLRVLYLETGRDTAWRRLVETVVPHFVDPATDSPLPGHENDWSLVTEYRVRLARSDRKFREAERLQRARVEWNRKEARLALEIATETRNNDQHNTIRTLAASIHELAQIQSANGDPTCAGTYHESLELATAIGDKALQEVCVYNLGRAYANIIGLHNLDEAERWYRRSLDLIVSTDSSGRGKTINQLGNLAYLRFREARTAKRPTEELARYLADAVRLYGQALEMTPETDIISRGVIHNALGVTYQSAGSIDRALHHYRQSIRYYDEAGDIFRAGQTRENVAIALLDVGRLHDALTYAEAALANFLSFGERAAAESQKTERLIAGIKEAQAKA